MRGVRYEIQSQERLYCLLLLYEEEQSVSKTFLK